MFEKYKRTDYRPEKPLLIWDGACSFCQYWKLRLQKITGDKVRYEPYQKIAEEIPDISEKGFEEAVRLIETDGKVYDGPDAAYQLLTYSNQPLNFSRWYHGVPSFRLVSDHAYAFISKRRSSMFSLTKLLWGKNPAKPKNYWMLYLAAPFALALTNYMISKRLQ